jgi:methyltransferase family protein
MSVRAHLRSLYLVPLVRRLVVRIRLFYFVRIRRVLKTVESPAAFKMTISHNIKSLGQCNTRIDLLIKPLSVVESVNESSNVLIIGTRDEHDIYTLIGHGFSKEKIRGLDLISYSPLIDLGDMHSTLYPDGTWDVIVVGWTLSYSSKPQEFAQEMMRIAKNGALIAIAVEYSTMSEHDEVEVSGYSIHERAKLSRRINSVKDILDLFSSHVGHVFFSHDAPLKISHGKGGLVRNVSNVGVIFSLSK